MFNQKRIILAIWALLKLTDIMLFTTYFLYFTGTLQLSYTLAVALDLPTMITQLLLDLPSGFIADRYGLRKTVIASFILLIIAPLLYFCSSNYAVMLLGSVFFGAGFAFFSGAFDSYCVEIYAGETKSLFTIRNIIHNAVNIIGPIIAIYLASFIGYRPFYLIDLIFKLVIVLIFILYMREVKSPTSFSGDVKSFLYSGFRVVLRALRTSRPILYNSVFSFLWGFASGCVDIFFIKTLAIAHGEANVGLVIAIMSLLSILSNLYVSRVHDLRRLYWLSFLLHAVFVLLVGLNFSGALVGLWLIFRSIFITIFDIAAPVLINKIIKQDRASLLSWFSLLLTAGRLVALLIIGIIADKLGIGIIWIIAGMILLVISGLLYKLQKDMDW